MNKRQLITLILALVATLAGQAQETVTLTGQIKNASLARRYPM